MGIFDSIVQQAKHSLGLSEAKASGLVAALLQLITNRSTGGFNGFIDRFRNAGLSTLVDSWINRGSNSPISNAQVVSALGSDTIRSLANEAGVDSDKATSAISSILPGMVDTLTPDGRIPDEASLMSQVGTFISKWGSSLSGAFGATAASVGSSANRAAYDRKPESSGGGSFLRWLLPLLLLGLLVALGFWFCGRGTTPATSNLNTNVNTNVNRSANTNTAKVVDSSFKIEAKDGKYVITGVVPDEATKKKIADSLTAQYGAGNVDLTGLKVDASAKPFAAGWWDNFAKMLPNLKDWKTGTLAFAGNAITEAAGLPAAAMDQLKSLFSGWTLPSLTGSGSASDAARTLSEVVLPGGTKLQAYPGGIEDQLVKFIQSDDYKNGTAATLKDKWFNFDDLNFKFGTNELVPESKRQLDNIVAILKAFPDVKVKIGGYTDKKGDDAANLKLSDGRAKSVQAAIQKAGVGAQVPEAEGYGEQFATVPETGTDEERKVDRKTSVRLIK